MADVEGGSNSIRQWLKNISAEYSSGQKLIFVITLISIMAGFFFLLRWATQPDYVALFSDMDLKDGDKVVEVLNSNNVPLMQRPFRKTFLHQILDVLPERYRIL